MAGFPLELAVFWGGIFLAPRFARIGDKCGRAVSLKLAIWGMALCTVLQGCLPTQGPGACSSLLPEVLAQTFLAWKNLTLTAHWLGLTSIKVRFCAVEEGAILQPWFNHQLHADRRLNHAILPCLELCEASSPFWQCCA